jgi:hypothetical protein
MDVNQTKKMSTTSDKLAHTFDMDVKISAKKKSGNVIAYTQGSRKSSEKWFWSSGLHNSCK